LRQRTFRPEENVAASMPGTCKCNVSLAQSRRPFRTRGWGAVDLPAVHRRMTFARGTCCIPQLRMRSSRHAPDEFPVGIRLVPQEGFERLQSAPPKRQWNFRVDSVPAEWFSPRAAAPKTSRCWPTFAGLFAWPVFGRSTAYPGRRPAPVQCQRASGGWGILNSHYRSGQAKLSS
jgi:hypothetical protein